MELPRTSSNYRPRAITPTYIKTPPYINTPPLKISSSSIANSPTLTDPTDYSVPAAPDQFCSHLSATKKDETKEVKATEALPPQEENTPPQDENQSSSSTSSSDIEFFYFEFADKSAGTSEQQKEITSRQQHESLSPDDETINTVHNQIELLNARLKLESQIQNQIKSAKQQHRINQPLSLTKSQETPKSKVDSALAPFLIKPTNSNPPTPVRPRVSARCSIPRKLPEDDGMQFNLELNKYPS